MPVPIYEIPLSPSPQRFSIQLGDKEYQLRLSYQNVAEGGWLLDIGDPGTGTAIINGIPLVTGVNLLEQYAYLGLGIALFVGTDGDPDAVPVFANLGTTAHLYFAAV